jgi:mono/diheme cytochrome c family protein
MLQRLLIEKMEHRILVGTLAFLATMLITGWIAINENARMAAFTQQYEARSIERGAALFAANCSTCHGEDGRGLTGRAPGLNNPYMFGHNFFASIEAEEQVLAFERENPQTAPERVAEIDARLAELEAERQALIAQMGPAIQNGYNPEEPNYLPYVGWAGSLENYVRTTLIHGRPRSNITWPASGGGMVAWAQVAGGPLRMDQVNDLVTYILNWDKGSNWTIDDLNAVNQYPIISAMGGSSEPKELVGSDVQVALAAIGELEGDSNNGQALYTQYACAGCHMNGALGPVTEGSWTRVNEVRLQDPALAGYTAEQYFVESILMPNTYISPGYQGGQMPQNFGDQLSAQELADLVAYLSSQDQPIE